MNEEHVKILKSGVAGWNAWRAENPDVTPNLCDANLCSANLCDANLRSANLCDANLCDANLRSANLRSANLYGANLRDANLDSADLRSADLRSANLCSANLCNANLCDANLRDANLDSADLRSADLRSANLCNADLDSANLCDADLPSPIMMLSAQWETLSDETTLALMHLDAAGHPDPTAFDRWAAGGECPYKHARIQRVANFTEQRKLWSPGPAPRIYDAMAIVLDEKCPGWRDNA